MLIILSFVGSLPYKTKQPCFFITTVSVFLNRRQIALGCLDFAKDIITACPPLMLRFLTWWPELSWLRAVTVREPPAFSCLQYVWDMTLYVWHCCKPRMCWMTDAGTSARLRSITGRHMLGILQVYTGECSLTFPCQGEMRVLVLLSRDSWLLD